MCSVGNERQASAAVRCWDNSIILTSQWCWSGVGTDLHPGPLTQYPALDS